MALFPPMVEVVVAVHFRSLPTTTSEKHIKCSPERIRVIIGDSTEIGCELLKTALSRDRRLDVVALATTMDEVTAATRDSEAEIVLVNKPLAAESGTGLACLRNLADKRVILLLQNGDQNEVIEAFRAGVKGVFRLSESLHSLTRCIHAVNGGQIWASSADLNFVMRAFSSAPSIQCIDANGNGLLTSREQQVLELVAQGLTNLEIASSLQLREHTIKNYLFKIYDKVGVSSRVELIMYALSHSAAA